MPLTSHRVHLFVLPSSLPHSFLLLLDVETARSVQLKTQFSAHYSSVSKVNHHAMKMWRYSFANLISALNVTSGQLHVQAALALPWVLDRALDEPQSQSRDCKQEKESSSVNQFASVIVVVVVLVRKPHSQKPQEALNLTVTEERYWALSYRPLYTFLHSLLNVPVQIANKMGLQKIGSI
jgi:hypothetical protein